MHLFKHYKKILKVKVSIKTNGKWYIKFYNYRFKFYNYRFTYFSKYLQHKIKLHGHYEGYSKAPEFWNKYVLRTAIKTRKSMNSKVENGWKK